MRIFSGIRPTGELHIGNYLGAIRQWLLLQEKADCVFCIVDLHAITTPYQSKELKKNIFEMAAAYAFHISQNHPFVDGNKRTALASALVFLELNGISISDPKERLYDAMIAIASGKMDKPQFAQVLRDLKHEAK